MHAPPAGQKTTWQLFIGWNRLACGHAGGQSSWCSVKFPSWLTCLPLHLITVEMALDMRRGERPRNSPIFPSTATMCRAGKQSPLPVRCFRHSNAGRPSWWSVTHRRRRSRAGTGLFVRTRWCPQWAAEVHGPPGGSSHRIRTELLHHGKTKSEPGHIYVKDVNIR